MADAEVVSPPQPPAVDESLGKPGDGVAPGAVADQRRDGKPERPRREPEDIPDMTVEEAQKALNALPKAEAQPDNEVHEQKVSAINEEIKKIKDQIEILRIKIEEANEARRGQGDEMGEARAVMRILKEERDEIRGQLDAMQAESARAKAALDGHDKSRRALQSSLKYKTVEEIEAAIREMESRQQTSSMSLAEEKKLVKEIEQLKQSKKTAAQYVSQEEAVGKAKDGYGAARKTESEKKAELRVVQEKLKAAFTTLEDMSKARDEEGGGVSTLFEEKKALHDQINEKIEEIKELRTAHRAKLDQWYNSKRERVKLKRALARADYLSRQEAKNARVKALEEEEAKKIPYESEMVLCDALVSYLETTFMKGDEAPVEKKAAPSAAAPSAEFGGMKMVMKKRNDEDFIVMGGGKKKGGGKKRGGGNKGNAGGTIVHAIDTMESFSLLSIPPPPNKAAVPDAIKALKDKKAWYSEQPRGAVTSKGKSSDKPKGGGGGSEKVKAPEITDEAFPSLPGMAPKPKVEEDEAQVEAGEGEEVGGDAEGEEGEEGEEEVIETGPTVAEIVTAKPETAAVSEEVAPTPTEAVVANGVNGKVAEAVAPEEDADAAEEKPAEVETKEDGEASAETSKENHLEPAKADAEEKTVAAAEFTAGTETAEEEHEADEEEEGGEVAAKEDGEED